MEKSSSAPEFRVAGAPPAVDRRADCRHFDDDSSLVFGISKTFQRLP